MQSKNFYTVRKRKNLALTTKHLTKVVALLLEEYALELLEPHIVKLPYGRIGDKLSPWAVRSNGVPGTASKPAALPSDSSRRIARMMHDVLESSDEREHRLAELVRLRAEQVRTKRRGNSPGMSRKHIKKRRLDVYKEDGDGVEVEYSSDEIHSSQDSN